MYFGVCNLIAIDNLIDIAVLFRYIDIPRYIKSDI
jgi:hypothetical protein